MKSWARVKGGFKYVNRVLTMKFTNINGRQDTNTLTYRHPTEPSRQNTPGALCELPDFPHCIAYISAPCQCLGRFACGPVLISSSRAASAHSRQNPVPARFHIQTDLLKNICFSQMTFNSFSDS